MDSSAASPPLAVLALGGNALARSGERATVANQFRNARASLGPIVDLVRAGWRVVIVHGNGPQVGDALVRNELAVGVVEPLPLGVLVASTAGWIGYMLQQSLENALRREGLPREVVTVITQTRVAGDDPQLARPTKPIGHALNAEMRATLESRGLTVARDGNGNWRRLAASPDPLEVLEAGVIRMLVEGGTVVIAAGGGGPPVYPHPELGWEGLDAVVDKDKVAALLAAELGAEVLLILTDVDAVYHGWGTPEARPLRRLDLAEARALLASDALGVGSMRPKMEAAVRFVSAGGGRAVIARLADGPAALRGELGTTIAGER